MNGLVVVLFNGNNDLSYNAFDLDGFTTNDSGYFVLGNSSVLNVDLTFPGNGLQNGADAVAIYQADAANFPDGSAVTFDNLVDAIVYDTNDEDDPELLVLLNIGELQLNEDSNAIRTINPFKEFQTAPVAQEIPQLILLMPLVRAQKMVLLLGQANLLP